MGIKLSARERILVLIAMLSVLFFAYYQYYLTPVLEEVGTIKEEVRESEERLGNLKETQKEMDLLVAEIDELKLSINELEILVPINPRTPEIITQIEAFSETAGVVLRGIDFSMNAVPGKETDNAKQENDYMEIPVQVFISGHCQNVLDFLKELEGQGRLYNVMGFELSTAQQAYGDVLAMSIDICAYALPAEEQMGM